MALHRGIQSAIFYYLSCAPCAEARYRKKRRQEAVLNRAERDALAEEMPDVYRHPEPSSTNVHWNGEIALGPTLQSRGRKKGRKSPALVLSRNISVVAAGTSALDLRALQREDEELWGQDNPIQRPERVMRKRGRSNETDTTSGTTSTAVPAQPTYSNFRSPPVSDLLPPIVRTVHSRDEVAWMMQPPPVADVMSGKSEPRSATTSRKTSTRTARTISRGSSAGTSSVMMTGAEDKIPPLDHHHHQGPTSARGGAENLDTSLATTRRVASRPPLLSTIASGNTLSSEEPALSLIDSAFAASPTEQQQQQQQQSPRRQEPHLHQHTRSNSDSKRGVGGSKVLKGRVFTTGTGNSSPASPATLATQSAADTAVYTSDGEEVREELFDNWYTPDFELGKWVLENTRREGIKERWSFDV